MMSRLLAISVAVFTMPILHAQEARLITARTLCFQYVDDVKHVFAPNEEGTMTEVPLFTSMMSREFEMRATEGAAVFSVPAEDPENPYRAMGKVKMPDSSRVLFLFLPASDAAKGPYRVIAIADDVRSFPWKSVWLMNLYNQPVRFHMGERSGSSAVVLEPGKSRRVEEIRRLDDLNRYPVLAEYRTPRGFAKFYHNAWQSIIEKRDIVIVYPDPATGDPKLNHYEDAKPAEFEDAG